MDSVKNNRVLLVDDEPTVAWSVGRYLTRSGINVTTCGDGEEAIDILLELDFDVLITDIQMPRLNGMALIDWVRNHRPNLKIVVITGFGAPAVRSLALKKGAVLYLEKPVDPELLLEILKSEHDKEQFSGVIHNIDLIEYLQLLLMSRSRVVIEVTSRRNIQGLIFIDSGDICHAQCQDYTGKEAFFKCLEFDSGTFSSHQWFEPSNKSIEDRGDFLLLEAARLKDEHINFGTSFLENDESQDDLSDDSFFESDFNLEDVSK